MKRGRPFGSAIRQRLVEILACIKEGYGYDIHKIYCHFFDHCTREVVYYNLRRGVEREEFKIKEIKVEKGDFSWGPEVRKIVYALGSKAQVQGTLNREAIEKFRLEKSLKTITLK